MRSLATGKNCIGGSINSVFHCRYVIDSEALAMESITEIIRSCRSDIDANNASVVGIVKQVSGAGVEDHPEIAAMYDRYDSWAKSKALVVATPRIATPAKV